MVIAATEEVKGNALLSTISVAHFSGINAEILLGGANAPFTVMKMSVSIGMGAPAHISKIEDKVFHITAGKFLFLVDEKRIEVSTGDHVFVRKGQIHSFCGLNSEESKLTLVSSPALHDQFFLRLSALSVPHVLEDVQSVCKSCHQEIVGPVIQP